MLAIAIGPIAISAGVMLLIHPSEQLVSTYHDHLRGDFSSASLTLAGFLFSVATFLLVRETPAAPQSSGTTPIDPRLPHKRIATMMLTSVVVSIAAAVLNSTIGLSDRPVLVLIAIGSVVASVTYVVAFSIVVWVYFSRDLG